MPFPPAPASPFPLPSMVLYPCDKRPLMFTTLGLQGPPKVKLIHQPIGKFLNMEVIVTLEEGPAHFVAS